MRELLMETSDCHSPVFTVVIPAFNEECRLSGTLDDAVFTFRERFPGSWELIVVDDGSCDGTVAVVKKYATHCPELRLVSHSRNQGKGAAVRTGMLASRGELILFADADHATPFSQCDELLTAVQSGADLACGSRFGCRPGQVRRTVPRRLMSGAFRLLAHWTVRPGLKDTQCGFKLFRRSAAMSLFRQSSETGYLFDIEILSLASRQGMQVSEVPVTWQEMPGSKVSLWRDSWRMLCGLFRIREKLRSGVAAEYNLDVLALPIGNQTESVVTSVARQTVTTGVVS
jgi:dolichyl-phosphate beta-glucosyltransferase